MNRSDSWVGAVLLLVALAILWHVQSFPPAPGQPYNAALFPGIAAVGLALCALALIIQSRRAPPPTTEEAQAHTAPRPAPRLIAIALTAGAIVFYLLVADRLGFVPTGAIILATLMWAYGVRPARIAPIAIISTLLIHLAFYKLLKVPLPWGVLQPIAW